MRLRELRNKNGMTQADLAKELAVAQNTLSYWEQGKFQPDVDTLNKLADYFNVTVDYLLGREEKPVQETQANENKIILSYRAKDKSRVEVNLSDEQMDLIKNLIDQMERNTDDRL